MEGTGVGAAGESRPVLYLPDGVHPGFLVGETILRRLRPGQWHSVEQTWAAARDGVFRMCVEPLLAELEQPQVSPLERNRKMILFYRLSELHCRLLPTPQRGANQADAQRKELQQAANEMLALIDAMERREKSAPRPKRKGRYG